ncbi:uncharacterized protein LOC115720282 [Cannabis sativa]|uniref:uncharacterized protein LOC115720282 n=1 Tax=Cannabis sativa TaxID=3483 RepID=UPI0029CA27FD|nr:uncharacterized protein LOC115720282 [Cannabis sativa]
MLQGLKTFSLTSGFFPNIQKTTVDCCGMQEEEIHRVLNISGFNRQNVPFRYLGVPKCAKRISAEECNDLVQKMIAKIKVWSSRNISFAGRVVLINHVLLTIHTYWCQLLILPKRIIAEIEKIFRNILWSQGVANGASNVAWDSLCKSKSVGGLGFKNTAIWNEAALFKHVWSIVTKKDNLWIKWVHSVYIKQGESIKLPQPAAGSARIGEDMALLEHQSNNSGGDIKENREGETLKNQKTSVVFSSSSTSLYSMDCSK